MTVRQPRYSKEEFARRGNDLYERQIRAQVEAGNHGMIVAIDIETGAYEVAEDVLTASDRLLARYPDAQAWFVRIGAQAVCRFGPYHVVLPKQSDASEREDWARLSQQALGYAYAEDEPDYSLDAIKEPNPDRERRYVILNPMPQAGGQPI